MNRRGHITFYRLKHRFGNRLRSQTFGQGCTDGRLAFDRGHEGVDLVAISVRESLIPAFMQAPLDNLATLVKAYAELGLAPDFSMPPDPKTSIISSYP